MEKYRLPLWVPLVVLFVIGIAGFWAPNYVPAIAILMKNGINEQWLGFVGSVVAAAMTIFAAGVAWWAVQKQIAVQQEIARVQTAIQKFSILESQFTALETERRLILRLKLQASLAENASGLVKNPHLNTFGARLALTQLQECDKAMDVIQNEFDLATNHKWIFPESSKQRRGIAPHKMQFEIALGSARIDLEFICKEYAASDESSILSPAELATCAAINLSPTAQALRTACDEFVRAIQPAIDRIEMIITQARLDAGV